MVQTLSICVYILFPNSVMHLIKDLARPPPTPVILKLNETRKFDVFCDDWWFSAIVTKIHPRYIYIKFDKWDDEKWDKYIYLRDMNDFIIFGKVYDICSKRVAMNDDSSSIPKPSELIRRKGVKFAPLNHYTIPYQKVESDMPSLMDTKSMYFYPIIII